MSGTDPIIVQLGCDPIVNARIIEDTNSGNLVIVLDTPTPDQVDIDALFFDVARSTDGTPLIDVSQLRIFPKPEQLDDDGGRLVTDFDASVDGFDRTNDGAIVKGSYDVRVEFGTEEQNSTAGDVNGSTTTFWITGPTALTTDLIDLQSLKAVINTEGGNGLALGAGKGDSEPTVETVTVIDEDFSGIHRPDQSDAIASDDSWVVSRGEVATNGCYKGALTLEEVQSDGPVTFNLDARACNLRHFEQTGHYADTLRVEVQIDGGDWILLDEFRVNDHGTALVGSETGQTITAHKDGLTYEGGVLNTVTESAQFRVVSDLTAANEIVFLDNFEVTATEIVDGDGGNGGTRVVSDDNILVNGGFEGLHPGQFNYTAHLTGWQSSNGIEAWGDGFLHTHGTEGRSFIELDRGTEHRLDSVYQDVRTEDGQTYQLSFDMAQRGHDNESVEVYWNNELVGTYSADEGGWDTFQVDVVGTGGNDRLEFRELASQNDSLGPLLDNVSLNEVTFEDGDEVKTVVQEDDFDHIHRPEQSDIVAHNDDWDIRHDALQTDGRDDGRLVFDEVQTDKDVEFSFDARADNIRCFEQSGHHADSLRVEVQIDGGDWVLLDEFRVNDHGTALVGSETGQEIGHDYGQLSYSGGILDTATQSVQFRFDSDISASNERIFIDNVEVCTVEPADDGGQGGDDCHQYAVDYEAMMVAASDDDDQTPADDTDDDADDMDMAA